MFGWPNGGRSEIRGHHNSKLASRRRQHRDDAIRDAGPRRLAARPKMWVCNSRMPSQFSGGYKRLWSGNNCSGTAKLCRISSQRTIAVRFKNRIKNSADVSTAFAKIALPKYRLDRALIPKALQGGLRRHSACLSGVPRTHFRLRQLVK
jgi:hypothetical protein